MKQACCGVGALYQFGKTEVGDENAVCVFSVFEEQVFWFKVAVHDFAVMQVLNGFRHLPSDTASVLFREVAFIHDAVEELTSLNVVQYEIQMRWRVKVVVHAHNVLVVGLPSGQGLHAHTAKQTAAKISKAIE